MGTKEIFEKEGKRTTADDWRVINLIRDGSFFRAYEVSAWLYHKHVNESFKLTHRPLKNINGSMIFLGFPVSNVQKNVPQDATLEQVDDDFVRVTLPAAGDESPLDLAATQKAFEEWKAAQPLVQAKSNAEGAASSSGETKQAAPRKGNSSGATGRSSLFSIAQEVLAFPIEEHSPFECMSFLSDLKKRLAQML